MTTPTVHTKALGTLRVRFDPNDRDTPVMVEKWKAGRRYPFATGTFHCALDTGELVCGDEAYELTPGESAFLGRLEDEAVAFFDAVRARLGAPE